MKKLKALLEKRWVAYSVATCSAVLLYMLLANLTGPVLEWLQSIVKISSPIIVGVVLAYLLNPLVNLFEKRVFKKMKNEKLKHLISVSLTIISMLLVVALLVALLVPALVESATAIVKNSDNYMESAQSVISKLSKYVGVDTKSEELIEKLYDWASKLLTKLSENIGTIFEKITTFGSSVINAILGFVLAIYFLLDKKNLVDGINKLRKAWTTEEKYEAHTAFLKRCHGVFLQYILYSLLDALIVGVANAIFMGCMRMPYIPLVSVIVGVTNLLPTFGPIIGAVVGAVVLLFDKPIQAVWFLAFVVMIQIVDANIIKPKLFHDSLGLPAVWTLISVIIGGKLFGVIGIFLAIPATVVLRFLYSENILPWIEKNKQRRVAMKLQEMQEDASSSEINDIQERKETE